MAQPSRPSATDVISAFSVNSLGSGQGLPGRAIPITYRPQGLRLNPTGRGFAGLLTKFFSFFYADCPRAADLLSR